MKTYTFSGMNGMLTCKVCRSQTRFPDSFSTSKMTRHVFPIFLSTPKKCYDQCFIQYRTTRCRFSCREISSSKKNQSSWLPNTTPMNQFQRKGNFYITIQSLSLNVWIMLISPSMSIISDYDDTNPSRFPCAFVFHVHSF